MKRCFFVMGILLTLVISACSPGLPAAPELVQTEQTPPEPVQAIMERSPTLPAQTSTLVPTAASLTPAPPPSDSFAISPETAGHIGLKATLHNDTLDEIDNVTWRPDGKAMLVTSGGMLSLLEMDGWKTRWSIPSAYFQVMFTPDGRELLALRGDEILRLDAATGELLSSNPITPDGRFSVTPDGLIVASTLGGDIILTSVATNQVIKTLPADINSGPIYDFAFSADGYKIVAGSMDGDLQAWDVQSGQRTIFRSASILLPVYECEVLGAIENQPAGSLLIVCSYPSNDYQIVYYQVGVYPATTTAEGSSAVIRDTDGRGYSNFTVNADRSRLAVFAGKNIEIWSAFGGSRLHTLNGAAGYGMAFNPAEKRLLAAWSKRSIQIWDINSGQKVDEWKRGGSDSPPIGLAFSPVSSHPLLAVGRQDGLLELWDISDHEKIASWQAGKPISSLAFSPDGRWLAVATDERKVLLFDPGLSSPAFAPQIELKADFLVQRVAFSPDSNLLYGTGYWSSSVYAWNLNEGNTTRVWSSGLVRPDNLIMRGETLLVGSGEGTVSIWDNPRGQLPNTIRFSGGSWLSGLEISPDRSQLVVARGSMLEVWNIDGLDLVRSWRVSYSSGILYSPDGCTLAVIEGKELKLMDTRLGEYYKIVSDKAKISGNLAFSSDGFLLATGYEDGRVTVLGLNDASPTLPGSLPSVRCGSFSPPPTPTATLHPTSTPIPSATPTLTVTPYRTATFTPTPPVFVRILSLTDPLMRGEDVLLLQNRLLELGYTEVGVPDGIFGKMTDSAVRRFQERNSLDVDGYVGPQTWQILFSPQAR